jgi:hypothetical protein
METDNSSEINWFNELTGKQQQFVLRGLAQANRRDGVQHEEVMLSFGFTTASGSEGSAN